MTGFGTRRDYLKGGAALAVAGLSACQEKTLSSIEQTVPGKGRSLYILADNTLHLPRDVSGLYEGRPFTLSSPFRIASVSKMMVAELAQQLHSAGRLDLDADAGETMGFALRHPDAQSEAVTLRHLIAHRSGIVDPPVYWMAAPGNIRTLLTDEIWEAGRRPGGTFRYSNLNYGIAATVMEAATGERFDQLFTRWIAEPLSLDIGFNWSGVSREKRRSGFPGLRGSGGTWEVQIDGSEMLNATEPAILREPGFRLEDYEIGSNGTLFSPQGGLRASMADLRRLGHAILLKTPNQLLPEEADPYRSSPRLGDSYERVTGPGQEDGHFVAFGDGVYVYPEGPLPTPSRKWVGHHGEAYGIYCGLWAVPETGAVFIHADLGSPPDGSPLTGGRPNNTVLATQAFEWVLERAGGQL